MKKHAVALRAFDHGDKHFAKGEFIPNLEHFGEWQPVGLVRAATAAEVARAKKPAPTKPHADGRIADRIEA